MYENFGWKWILIAFLAVGSALAWGVNGIPLGLDLAGGSELIYTLDGKGKNVDQKTTDTVVQILRDRIDKLGIKELSIARLGNTQIVIQVPGATSAELDKIRGQIERAGKLEFKLVVSQAELSGNGRKNQIEAVKEQKRRGEWSDSSPYDIATYHPSAKGGIPGEYELLKNALPNGKPLFVDGGKLEDAYRTPDSDGRAAVGFTWNSEGKKQFQELTEKNIGQQLAVVLDNEIRSAPSIRSAIGKRGVIEGGDKGWEEKELNSLIITLKGGALPAKPVYAYQKQVGAQLGRQAVQVGVWAMGGALLAVMLFMAYYYGVTGIVADIAMAMNILLILGIQALFEGTLTLPGIAGVVLTGGMSVDANILINERVREELARGSALKQALQTGYQRAFWTIFDSHVTTVLTAIVLMWVGTGPIKGFGLTLTVGIVASLFTSLFVTQTIIGWLVARGIVQKLKFKEWFHRPSIDWVALGGRFIAISIVFITLGWLVFLGRGSDKLGIDFTGGTQLHMRLKHPLEKGALMERIETHMEKNAGKSRSDYSLDVQQAGAGDGEKSREWLIRAHLIGGKKAKQVADTGAGSAWALIPAAYGQEGGGDPAPVATPAPVGSPSTSDVGSPATAAPVGSPAAPTTASAPEFTVGEANQDNFFSTEIRKVFKDELVNPYPKPTEIDRSTPGTAKVTVTANLVGLPPRGAFISAEIPLPTADMLKSDLPRILRREAAELTRPQDQARRKILEKLAGTEGQPGFEVAAVTGSDEGEGVATFTISASVEDVPADVKLAEEALKDSLAKAVSDDKAQFMPAFPFPNVDEIGSSVAQNLKQKAIVATIFSIIFICLYIWLRFDFWAGVGAVVALAHDVVALAGFMALADLIISKLGLAFDVKFNLTSISAFLTVVGYAINDRIVILDRIREERHLAKAKGYTPEVVNLAINKTLSRTILTMGTIFLTVMVLFMASLTGLGSIQGLSLALVFGTLLAIYGSVAIAAPMLLAEPKKVYVILGALSGYFIVTYVIAHFVVS